jgi:hypothetical protein
LTAIRISGARAMPERDGKPICTVAMSGRIWLPEHLRFCGSDAVALYVPKRGGREFARCPVHDDVFRKGEIWSLLEPHWRRFVVDADLNERLAIDHGSRNG